MPAVPLLSECLLCLLDILGTQCQLGQGPFCWTGWVRERNSLRDINCALGELVEPPASGSSLPRAQM